MKHLIICPLIIPAGYKVELEKLVEKTYADDNINGRACCKQSHEEYIEPHIHADSGGCDKAEAEIGELENLALQTVHRYAEYPLFIVSLASIIKRVFRIPVHRLERKVFKFTYLCLGLIAASRISMYVGLYVFFMALFAAGTAIYISLSAYVFSTNCLNTASYPAGIIKWRTIRLRVIRRSVTGLCMGYGHNKCRGPFHQVPRHFLYRINDCFDLSVITSWFILFGKLK